MQPPVRVVINMMHTCTSHRFRPMKNLATLPFFPLLIGFRTASGPTKQGSLIIPLHRLALISRIDTCGLTSKAGCRRSRLLPLVATSGWISLCTLTPTRGRRTSQRRNLFLLPPAANNGVGASQRFCHGQRPPRLLQERITLTHHSIRRSLLLLCPLAGPTAEELFVFQLQVCVRAAVWRLARAAVILDSLAIGGLASRTNHSSHKRTAVSARLPCFCPTVGVSPLV
mmetsp:Transcript_37281/g.106655  ORF Transcript_37281/g.106655 Transcript_37281/m.106655 type:complete len:227 (-) Transcript_37281:1026-1706(-)